MLCTFAACTRASRPDERRAPIELQRVLDRLDYGVWRVNAVKRLNGRAATHQGSRAYVMDAEIDVTIVRSVEPNQVLTQGVQMLLDVWRGRTWLLNLIGPAGQRKIVTLQLLWVEKDNGWELLGPCSDCGS